MVSLEHLCYSVQVRSGCISRLQRQLLRRPDEDAGKSSYGQGAVPGLVVTRVLKLEIKYSREGGLCPAFTDIV